MAEWSYLAMVTSAVIYLVAVAAHAAEWAASRRTEAVVTPGRVLVGAGATSADAPAIGAAGDTGVVAVPSAAAAGSPGAARPGELAGRIGVAFTVIGAITHATGVVLRGVAADRLPWGNMYEFVTASLLFGVLAYLFLVFRYGMRWLGLPLVLLASVGQGLAVTVFYVEVAPLVPALHSVWFIIHIVAAAIAGAAFNLGAIAAILYLIKDRAERRGTVGGVAAQLPSLKALDVFSYRLHAFAFPMWTFTLAAGSIWADYAWGRFWGWDPKETWTLVTWVVYAAYLHARATAGWKGRRAAWLAVLGVATFWFNFVGINLLVTGLHSYAGI